MRSPLSLPLRDSRRSTDPQSAESWSHPPKVPSVRRRLITLVISIALTLFWAVAANIGLNLSTWLASPGRPLFRVTTPAAPIQNVTVVWLVILLVLCLTGRLWLTLGITGLMTVGLMAINMSKLELRQAPLFPSDASFLSQPGFLQEMVGAKVLVMAVIGVIVVIAASVFLGRLAHRFVPHVHTGLSSGRLWAYRGVRLGVGFLCAVLLISAGNFNAPHNKWRSWYDSTGLVWKPFDQRVNYIRNGFVGGALFNMNVKAMKTPPGYSRATMAQVAARYRQRAIELNASRTGTLDDTNIVLVLSESFTQPTWLKSVKWSTDPIPGVTKLMQQTLSGRMLSPGYGGGTANIEFELLTSQSMGLFTPQLQTAYEQLVPGHKPYPSMVDWFVKRGHKAIAVHPFSFRMYRRPEVFKDFGFTKLVDRDNISYRGRVDGGTFISDRAAFRQVRKEIADHSEPVLLHLLSMQNHMPYGRQYADPIPPESGLPPGNSRLAGQYARGLSLTDQALVEFLDQLKDSSESTAVVFYGDHLPGQVYPPTLAKQNGQRLTHETPYLIWSNRKQLAPTPQPTTSPTQFLPMLFGALNVPVPPLYALLDDVRAQLPAVDANLMIDADDDVVRRSDLTPAQKQVLKDYRLVQYDLSIGKRYSKTIMMGDAPTSP